MSWADLPVLSRTAFVYTDEGIQFDVALHHRLATSPACLGILLHEMAHIWDELTWKPVEAAFAPFGHGYFWAAKVEQVWGL